MSNTDPNAEQPTPGAPATPETPAAPEAPAQPYAPPAGSSAPQYAPPVAPPAAPAAPAAPQYAPPAQQYNAAPSAPTNTLAIISMISSIVGIFSWGILSILGIILGHISLKQIKQRGEGGRGMAITGLIVGYIGIAIYIIITLILVLGFFAIAASGTLTSSSF